MSWTARLLTALLLLAPLPAWAEATLTVITYNTESDADTDPALVAKDIARIAEGVDLWALTEVGAKLGSVKAYREAAASSGARYRYVLGTHGKADRMAVLYDIGKFQEESTRELTHIPGSRKPLVVELRHKQSGIRFFFVVNHFNRRDAERRQIQAEELRKWAVRRRMPVILAGDFNFDLDPKTGEGNEAFDIFMEGEGIRMLEPACVANGNCPSTGTQCDQNYNSILDFIFLSGRSDEWIGRAEILFPERATCARDHQGYADHRPVQAVIEMR